MLRPSVAILAVGMLLGAVGDSRAKVTHFTASPDPRLLGDLVTFQAVQSVPVHQTVGHKWEVQGVAKDGSLGNWLVLPESGSSMSRYMSCVGRLNVRLTVTYSPMLGLSQTIITQYVDILPPDNDVVVQGFNTPTQLDPLGTIRLTVKFEMRRGTTPIGGMIDGSVQEDLLSWQGYNPVAMQWYNIPYTPGWDPPVGQSSSLFYKQANAIIDMKSTFIYPEWWYTLYAQSFGWMKNTQVNRLVTSNWVGEQMIYEFPAHHFTFRKSGANTWVLTE